MLDPDPHGFGTFAWIQIRIRTFSYIYIHESLKNSCGHYISFDWVCYTVFCRNPDSIATVLFIVCFGVLMFSFFIEDEKQMFFLSLHLQYASISKIQVYRIRIIRKSKSRIQIPLQDFALIWIRILPKTKNCERQKL